MIPRFYGDVRAIYPYATGHGKRQSGFQASTALCGQRHVYLRLPDEEL